MRSRLNIDEETVVNFGDCARYFWSESSTFVNDLQRRLKMGCPDFDLNGDGEVYRFLEFVAACYFYGKSPTALCDPVYAALGLMQRPIMNYSRFMKLLGGLGGSTNNRPFHDDNSANPDHS